jgi:hypothetical protein
MPAANTRKGPLRCPYCGNEIDFALYVLTCRVEHWRQVAASKFRRMAVNPSKLDTQAAPLLVCSSCALPLGAPPPGITAGRMTPSRHLRTVRR